MQDTLVQTYRNCLCLYGGEVCVWMAGGKLPHRFESKLKHTQTIQSLLLVSIGIQLRFSEKGSPSNITSKGKIEENGKRLWECFFRLLALCNLSGKITKD